MKLSKSKLALAKVINENGGWPSDEANFAAQDKIDGESNDNTISFYSGKVKPTRLANNSMWRCENSGSHFMGYEKTIRRCKLLANWHQTCLSREEYYQAYPKEDAYGWIEWKGGKCPVDGRSLVNYKMRDDGACVDGEEASDLVWEHCFGGSDIIAYRLHKPDVKPELCESVTRSIPEQDNDDAESRLAKALELVKEAAPHLLSDKYKFNGDEVMGERKPTIERLAQDYRNKLDFANRKQQDADNAKAAANAALGELERAGEAIGLLIGIAKPDPEMVITDWRDLKVGDVVECIEDNIGNEYSGVIGVVQSIDYDDVSTPVCVDIDEVGGIWCHKVKFICRP